MVTSSDRKLTKEDVCKLAEESSTIITRSWFFRRMMKRSFQKMDYNGNGKVSQKELYTGLLLIHLQLANYVGSSACSPNDEATIDNFFEALDIDGSGKLGLDEFSLIMVICCSQIATRILFQMLMSISLVPLISKIVTSIVWDYLLGHEDLTGFFVFIDTYFKEDGVVHKTLMNFPGTIIGLIASIFVIPFCLNKIDAFFYNVAEDVEAIEEKKSD
eukprot:CAMPEP_0178946938 /NCGR_PEP_ID=MMETSP0789-20121207/4562_1 /TAXON_ID=3005 /ORGANISM="Rhizosolenia setigera, Strain CCMP 1694" /LENGTH=215 /DNA_ID=CAMNT_0020626983 /DNA_START=89 /DNA_END=736 /DNA_ORIENTATION=+